MATIQREREAEEERGPKSPNNARDTIMVGGMDGLVTDEENVEIEPEHDEIEEKARPREKAGASDSDSNDDAEDERDARLAYDEALEDDDEGVEERGNSRRSRRNKARRDAIAQRDQELDGLRMQVQQLSGMVSSVSQGQVGVVLNTVENQLGQAQQQLQVLDDELGKAVAAGDGDHFRKAQRLRDEASARVFQLATARQRIIADAQQGQQRQQGQMQPRQGGPAASPAAAKYSEVFMDRHPWFKAEGGSEESEIVKAIDDHLAAEGYNPNTPLYWRTLEERVRARGLGSANDDGESDRHVPRRSSGMPPTNAPRGSRGSAAPGYQLKPEMREYLESEGLLESNLDADQKAKKARLMASWKANEQKAKQGLMGKN
tara:strand:+ start:2006 stop:3130 length:1125 start_codon:yes stop_codon:yes gene_type:complete